LTAAPIVAAVPVSTAQQAATRRYCEGAPGEGYRFQPAAKDAWLGSKALV
jgi:hypothetical protein